MERGGGLGTMMTVGVGLGLGGRTLVKRDFFAKKGWGGAGGDKKHSL